MIDCSLRTLEILPIILYYYISIILGAKISLFIADFPRFVLTARYGELIVDRNDTIIKINNDAFAVEVLGLNISVRHQNNQEKHKCLCTPRIHGGLTKNFASRRYL